MKRYQVGDPLPVGHICRCHHCAANRFPPEHAEQRDVRVTVIDGHFKTGWYPVLTEVRLDGAVNLYVVEFQLGREPWALVCSDPVYHRCQNCIGEEDRGRLCYSLIFPREITYTVGENMRWNEVKARNTTPEAIADWERMKGRLHG